MGAAGTDGAAVTAGTHAHTCSRLVSEKRHHGKLILKYKSTILPILPCLISHLISSGNVFYTVVIVVNVVLLLYIQQCKYFLRFYIVLT